MRSVKVTNASEIRRDYRFVPYMKNGNIWESTGVTWEITRPVRQGEIVNGDQFMNYRGTYFFAHRLDNPNDIVFNFDHLQKDQKWPDFFDGSEPVLFYESQCKGPTKWQALWIDVKGLFK